MEPINQSHPISTTVSNTVYLYKYRDFVRISKKLLSKAVFLQPNFDRALLICFGLFSQVLRLRL